MMRRRNGQNQHGLIGRIIFTTIASIGVLAVIGLGAAKALDYYYAGKTTPETSNSDMQTGDTGGQKLSDTNMNARQAPSSDAEDYEGKGRPSGRYDNYEAAPPSIPAPEIPSGSGWRSSGSFSSGWSSTVNGEQHGSDQHWTYQQPGTGWRQESERTW